MMDYLIQAEAAARWFSSIKHADDCVSQLGGLFYDGCDCGAEIPELCGTS